MRGVLTDCRWSSDRNGWLARGIGIAVIACTMALSACSQPISDREAPPNIILVSLDTLRADHLGCYGSERNTSPAIDAIAKESVVFLRAIAQSSHTSASHISLFQSRYPSAAKESASHLAEAFDRAGYQTAAFTGGGKISAKSRFGFDRGFERYEDIPQGLSRSAPIIEDWLQFSAQRPFFLFIHTYDIHSPYDPGPPFDTLYFPEYDGPVVPEKTRDYLRELIGAEGRDHRDPEILWDDADRQKLEALYDGGINYTDEYMRQLFDLLGRTDAWNWDADILVLISDHGEEFWDHGSVAHGQTLYQELIRVPLIVRLPGGQAAGSRIVETVQLMDLGPTLLDLAGVEKPATFWGNSLLSLMNGQSESVNQSVISQTTGVKSIIQYPWKLIINTTKGDEVLFNLEDDPAERFPLQQQHPEIVERLKVRLRAEVKNEPVPELFVDSDVVDDEELKEQLRVLGYINR